ncbi:uncharacterized protein LOC134226387 isoform X2 [Armigeres subalbatus]|uniref:uncharacterized protein LOC134226387 isoform X2 n=1 Tax=Armigeres subalbatus TaxID=124917 RepID=UPI002ED06114
MMPESSFQKLNDETFPASLLMEFDELDDDIPISPPRTHEPVNVMSAPGSRSPVAASQTSNSSSGNYSLSTENDNGSGSSNSRHTFVKISPATSKPQKRAKSEENLLGSNVWYAKNGGVPRSQKYGHVKSKVKQYIEETLSQHTRHSLVRHKSMPESSIESVLEQKEEHSPDHDASTIRGLLEEKSTEVSYLQRHLEFSEMLRRDGIAKIEVLKQKIEAMRMEHSMREKERQRERDIEKDLDRKLILANYMRYSSQNSLHKAFTSVSTQTSPEALAVLNNSFIFSDESIDRMHVSKLASITGASPPPRAKRALTYVADSQPERFEFLNDENFIPDSATHPCSSPDYPELCPTAVIYHHTLEDNAGDTTELLIPDNSGTCNECGRKNKNRKSKKARLASFFCIKKVD